MKRTLEELKELQERMTLGPWSAVRYTNYTGWSVYASQDGCIAEQWYNNLEASNEFWERMEYNAKAIAALPEILAELIEMKEKEG